MAEDVGNQALIQATKYYQPAGSGGSAAVLLRCSDGQMRVVKLQNNPQDRGQARQNVLGNELIVARIAAALGASCADGTVVHVEEQYRLAAAQDVGGLIEALPGPSFGSLWSAGGYNPSVHVFQDADNRPALAGLAVLYRWTRNTDVKSEHFTWSVTEHGTRVLGFDHGMCFEHAWTQDIRNKAGDVPQRPFPAMDSVLHADDLRRQLDTVNGFTREIIEAFVSELPTEWAFPPRDLEALADYLHDSRPTLTATVMAEFGL